MNDRDLERLLYKGSRTIGDVRAAGRGTDVLARRLLKRAWHRKLIGLLRRGGVW